MDKLRLKEICTILPACDYIIAQVTNSEDRFHSRTRGLIIFADDSEEETLSEAV